jgi:hypothetical protein
MNPTHIHLFLNHLPFIGLIFSVLFLFYFMIKKNYDMVKVILYIFVLLAIVTVPVFLTGDPAGETVKKIAGIDESIIDRHEDAAWISFSLMIATGLLAIVGIYMIKKSKSMVTWFKFSLMFIALACAISLGRTASFGGDIRHSEIKSDQEIRVIKN